MLFASPTFLVLLLGVPALGWLALRSRAALGRGQRWTVAVLQTLAWTALVLALADPWTERTPRTVRIAVVTDGEDEAEWRGWRDATPFADPFFVVRAAARPVVGERGATAPPATASTPDLPTALRTAAALGAGHPTEVAVFGSAAHGGPPLAETTRALAAVRLHWRQPGAARPRIAAVEHPARIDELAAFAVTVRAGDHGGCDAVVLTPAGPRSAALGSGRSAVVIDLPPLPAGLHALEVELRRGGTVLARARSAVLVRGRPRVLYAGAGGGAFRATVEPHGFEVVVAEPGAELAIAGAHVVVIDDVPAHAWPETSQRALAGAVVAQGTGLLLAGLHRNLGPGGYASSPLADVLPVAMPQREERRDPSTSLVLIIDTSGSMGSRVELAKEVSRLAMRELLPHDKVGIVEFYGSKRWAAPLQPAANVIELQRALNRLQAGGGTVIYSAIEEAYYALLNARTRFKHVLVLTDGGVEAAPFEALLRKMADAGINTSTVLIGPQSNSEFLIDLAQWGSGRFYACPSRFQLPQLRFKEPQSSLLPAAREQPVALARPRASEATAALGDELPGIGGTVDAELRPGAEALLATAEGRPLWSAWDQGRGRVVVGATELLGPRAAPLRDDAGYAAFVADLLRSAARRDEPELEVTPFAGFVRVAVAAPERPRTPPPTVLTGGERWAMTPAAGGFVAELPWPGEHAFEVVVEGIAAAPLRAAAVAPTGDQRRDDGEALLRLVAASGGTSSGPLPAAGPVAAARRHASFAGPLALAALALFALGLLVRRLPLAAAAVAIALAPGLGAQDPPRPHDAIRAELAATGSLDAALESLAGAPVEQRIAWLHERGDLRAIVAELEGGDETADRRTARALYLDALGRLGDAAVAARQAADATAGVARARWLVQEAQLAFDAGDGSRAAAALRAAVEGAPELRSRVARLAGGYGSYDLAVELAAGAATTDLPMALLRASWLERLGRVDESWAAFRRAHALAPSQRDRRFVAARIVALMRAAGRLEELADGLAAELAEHEDAVLRDAWFDVLRELGRGDELLDWVAGAGADAHGLRHTAMRAAFECGRAERAAALGRELLAADPGDTRLRITLAIIADDLRHGDAEAILRGGLAEAGPRDFVALAEAAAELGADGAFTAALDRLRAHGDRGRAQAALLESARLRARGLDGDARAQLERALDAVAEDAERVRLADALESTGATARAIEVYREAWQRTDAEDLGLRLGWLLARSDDASQRREADAILRRIWLGAGSAARRVQAEERVLDLAAKEGTLADLAVELEEQLADPGVERADAKRQALVKIYSRAGDPLGAAGLLLALAGEPGREVDAWQRLAQVYLENDEFRRHEHALLHLIEIDAEHELDYRQQLALSALERGRIADARRVVDELLGRGDLTPDAFEFGAGIYRLAGRTADAARLYRRALARHPERVETYLSWGEAWADAGHRDLVVGRFAALLLEEPPDDLLLVAVDGLLNADAGPGALRFATRVLRRRIAEEPGRIHLRRALQDLAEELGDEPARLRCLEDTTLLAAGQRSAWLRELADDRAAAGDWQAYCRHGRLLLAAGDELPPAVFLDLGEALVRAGDLRAAERAFQRARLAPDFAATEVRIAELYEETDLLGDAERVRRRILRRNPDRQDAMVALARVLERRGTTPAAHALYCDAALAAVRAEPRPDASSRRFSRNRSDDGPDADAVVRAALRTAGDLATLDPLRAVLEEQVRDPRAGQKTRLAAFDRLTTLLRAADATPAEWRAAEDALLGPTPDDAARRTVVAARLARGDLDGAAAVDAGDATAFARFAAAVGGGDPDEARRIAAGANAAAHARLAEIAWLAGHDEIAAESFATLRAAGDRSAATARLAWLLGEPFDEAAAAAEALERALAAEPLRARVAGAARILRDQAGAPAAARRAAFAALAADAAAERDAAQALAIANAAGDELPPDQRAELVRVGLDGAERAYSVSQWAPHLHALAADEAERLVRAAFARCDPTETRPLAVRLLLDAGVPIALRRRLATGLDLERAGISERAQLARLCAADAIDGELGAALVAAFGREARRDPIALVLAGRIAVAPAERDAALLAAVDALVAAAPLDSSGMVLAECAVAGVGAAARSALLERPGDSAAHHAVRAAVLRANGDAARAADELVAACAREPDNLTLITRTAPLLLDLGRHTGAAELYERQLASSATVYPFYAERLADLWLRLGRPDRALSALHRTEDDHGTTLDTELRAIAALPAGEPSAAGVRRWLQRLQERGPRRISVLVRHERLRAADVLPLPLPALAPATVEAAMAADAWPDALAMIDGGAAGLAAALRAADEDTAESLGAARARLRAAADPAAAVAAARARRAAAPGDPAPLRTLVAAAQLGEPIGADELAHAAALLLVDTARTRAMLGLELLLIADRQGLDATADRLARWIGSDRTPLHALANDERLPGALRVAFRRCPAAAVRLGSGGPPNANLDAVLLAAALCAGPIPDTGALRDAYADAFEQARGRSPSHRGMNIALPWCGLCLRLGAADAALAALAIDDPQLENGDSFAPEAMLAAVPPAAAVGAEALDRLAHDLLRAARHGELGRRLLGARLAAVVAWRHREAGDAARAKAIDAELGALAGALPALRAWLTE